MTSTKTLFVLLVILESSFSLAHLPVFPSGTLVFPTHRTSQSNGGNIATWGFKLGFDAKSNMDVSTLFEGYDDPYEFYLTTLEGPDGKRYLITRNFNSGKHTIHIGSNSMELKGFDENTSYYDVGHRKKVIASGSRIGHIELVELDGLDGILTIESKLINYDEEWHNEKEKGKIESIEFQSLNDFYALSPLGLFHYSISSITGEVVSNKEIIWEGDIEKYLELPEGQSVKINKIISNGKKGWLVFEASVYAITYLVPLDIKEDSFVVHWDKVIKNENRGHLAILDVTVSGHMLYIESLTWDENDVKIDYDTVRKLSRSDSKLENAEKLGRISYDYLNNKFKFNTFIVQEKMKNFDYLMAKLQIDFPIGYSTDIDKFESMVRINDYALDYPRQRFYPKGRIIGDVSLRTTGNKSNVIQPYFKDDCGRSLRNDKK